MDYLYGWKPYIPVAARRRQAERAAAKLQKHGRATSPVHVDGRKIATTFWGTAWCDNLERYSDYANRLPRGRTYVRNGSVIDLQMVRGAVTALVSGSDVYEIRIDVKSIPKARWLDIRQDCTGAIDSLVELLQGRLSSQVMTRVCEPGTGLFPEPRELAFQCSCPDWAAMCKHVAAVLYGVGARLDQQPELLFLLRGVNQHDLIAGADAGVLPRAKVVTTGKVLDAGNLSDIFGIEMAETNPVASTPGPVRRPTPARSTNGARSKRKTTAKAAVEATDAVRAAKAATKEKAAQAIDVRSPAGRKSVAERMKKYWAARRRKPKQKRG
jgi:uncharacterized Zn finger protein